MNSIVPLELLPGKLLSPLIWAQIDNPISGWFGWSDSEIGQRITSIVYAILIFVVGWIIAAIAGQIVKKILMRSSLDNRLANWMMGSDSQQEESVPIEQWVSNFVYWVILLFAIVAALTALELDAVTQPLNAFLSRIFNYLPQIGAAIAWLVGGWAVGTIAKLVLTRGLQVFNIDERINRAMGEQEEQVTPVSINENLGNALYWFILLFAFYFALGALGLQEQVRPIENLLDEILAALPQILKALIIFAFAWVIARLARGIVTNLLAATGIDALGERIGLSQQAGSQNLSWLGGTLVYAIIFILAAISILEELQIQAISGPAIAMLEQVLDAIPLILAAIAILVVTYFVGRFVANLVTSILSGIGFDNVFAAMGVPFPTPSDSAGEGQPSPESESQSQQTSSSGTTPSASTRTPSEIAGIVVLVGIMFFGVLFAVNVLQFEELSTLVAALMEILGRALVGVVVFGIGLYFANLAFNIISSQGSAQARLLGQTARIVIIAFVSAMALQQIGIATNIVNLAFGLVLGSIAVAVAIAFGVGGKDIAAEQIRQWLDAFKNRQ
ncbi:mechanosensitive ion channel [Geitlerinema sp. PCC 9228]|jgi:hypothetical protein|uniref:mechanosensitive ion channel n=1 Tax=Geitlerinema sp. PCC 9228 TaxID=111611 RepID=UPI0009FBDFC1|nr:mechanosensitive ion channel [Geitlerinema sp. PCC 9228]